MDVPNLPDTSAFDSAMPMWAKIVGYLGFPVVVASTLLWVFTDQLQADRALLVQHSEAVRAHSQVTVQQYVNNATIGAATLRALSQICANGAKTQEDRLACATVVIPQAILPTPQ